MDRSKIKSTFGASASGSRLGLGTSPIDRLLQDGSITPEQVTVAVEKQRDTHEGLRLLDVLVELASITPEQATRALAASVGTPFAKLTRMMVRPASLSSLPAEMQSEHNLLPLSFSEGWLTIAMESFTSIQLIEEVSRAANAKVQVVAATGENIRSLREEIYAESASESAPAPRGVASGHDLEHILGGLSDDDASSISVDVTDDAIDASVESPAMKLVDFLIQSAVEAGASDIHVEPDEKVFRVRMRVDGEMIELVTPPSHLLAPVVSRLKIMSSLDISERRLAAGWGNGVYRRWPTSGPSRINDGDEVR